MYLSICLYACLLDYIILLNLTSLIDIKHNTEKKYDTYKYKKKVYQNLPSHKQQTNHHHRHQQLQNKQKQTNPEFT